MAKVTRRSALLSCAGLLIAAAVTSGDVIHFKDGYTVSGTVKREKEQVFDPVSNQLVDMERPTGAWVIDDGARWTFFGEKQIGSLENMNPRADFILLRRDVARMRQAGKFPKGASFKGDLPEFNNNGYRQVMLKSLDGTYHIDQKLHVLTPHYLRIDATSHLWASFHLTREMGPEWFIRQAKKYPDLVEPPGKPDIDKRMKLVKMLTQAKWYKNALDELDRAATDLPKELPRIDAERAAVKSEYALAYCDEIDRARAAGRSIWANRAVQQVKKDFDPLNNAGLIRVTQLQGELTAEAKQAADAKKLMDDLLTNADPTLVEFAFDVTSTIGTEIEPPSAQRLEAFLSLGKQAERERTQGRAVSHNPGELLALAVSGWLLGKNAAEPRLDYARRLWATRTFLLDYLRTHEVAGRSKLLTAYQAQQPLPFDIIDQILKNLPLAEPGPAPEPEKTVTSFAAFPTAVEFPACRTKTRYWLQLPPEYKPTQSYPLLVVLPNAGEQPKDTLTAWAALAARDGVILVAPEWNPQDKPDYKYDPEIHVRILEVIRDLRSRYRVDGDRINLFGYNEAANLALDLGLSHPDQFAGVATMNAQPQLNLTRFYWRNAQYLPLYMVTGDLIGDAAGNTRKLFDQLLKCNTASLFVIYKGRGAEAFTAELPNIMAWFGPKRRARPAPELGYHDFSDTNDVSFQTIRPGESRFYWLEAENVESRHRLNDSPKDDAQRRPAKLQASIRTDNTIVVKTNGVKEISVWLGRDMIDFDKKLIINWESVKKNRIFDPKAPSLEIMLEDVYYRGDVTRPYCQKYTLKSK